MLHVRCGDDIIGKPEAAGVPADGLPPLFEARIRAGVAHRAPGPCMERRPASDGLILTERLALTPDEADRL